MATAHAHLDGRPAAARDGLRVAARCLPQLLAWTTLSITMGAVLHVVAERLGVAGRFANWAMGMAWSLATVFIVPVIVIEGSTVRRGVPRSARLFRDRWGETMTAQAGVGLVAVAAGVVLCPIVVLVSQLSTSLAIAVCITTALAGVMLVNALDSVVTVALFHYASEGRTVGGFSEDDLRSAFRRD